mmetsp:Transcript_18498/g.24271  ORF Transcript_18498/g.24271 Transcript_18498/m.24271 type:complete len:125 (+) Transcript_18498:164-538(+)
MADQNRHAVSVKAIYRIPTGNSQDSSNLSETSCSFDASNVEIGVIGLPKGFKATKPQAGDYTYSGMHDQGPLPPPKEGGDMALLIGCVQEAKKHSDNFLTEVIKKEKLHSPPPEKGKASKKSKN